MICSLNKLVKVTLAQVYAEICPAQGTLQNPFITGRTWKISDIQFQVFLEGQVQKGGSNNNILSIYLGGEKKGKAMYNVNS